VLIKSKDYDSSARDMWLGSLPGEFVAIIRVYRSSYGIGVSVSPFTTSCFRNESMLLTGGCAILTMVRGI